MLVREKINSAKKYGHDPWKRPIPLLLKLGVVNLDKPAGVTSSQATGWVKQMLEAGKAGHSGTLDPKVTGVLPVMLNNATKVVGAVLESSKEYVGVMHLHSDVELEKVKEVAEAFVGTITQTPPVKSAVKREPRERRIYSLEILENQGRDILFKTEVEAGTYIRKLCHDIGGQLGVGAHMTELRRTKAGPFTESSAVTLQELSEAWNLFKENGEEALLRKAVLPVEEAVKDLPKIYVKDSAVDSICNGSRLGVNGIAELEDAVREGGQVAVMTLRGEVVSLGRALMDAALVPEAWEGDAATTDRVIMGKNTYPKIWGKQKA